MSPVSSLSSSARPRAKYKVGDIIAWPSWEGDLNIAFGKPTMPEIIKIVAIEEYGCTIQYRTLTLSRDVVYVIFGWPGWREYLKHAEWWISPGFFQNDSTMETNMINIRLPLLVRYGIY